MPMSPYFKGILTGWFQSTAFPADPTTVYIALYVGDPTGAGTEPSGANYARVAVTANATNLPASAGVMTNGIAITFPTPSATWGTPTYAGILSASSGGNLWVYGALSSVRSIPSGAAVRFPIGDLAFTFT